MTYRAPVNDMLFMMRHVGRLDGAMRDGIYPDLSLDLIQDILAEAARFSDEVLAPINRTGDRHGVRLHDGIVTTAPGFKEAYQAWVAGGWSALAGPAAHGGQGLPQLINAGCFEMWNGACLAFGVAPLLTFGGAEAVAAHGSEELKQRYLGKLVAGEWTATMNLTEPQAGSDLGAIRTRAEPADDGSYRIRGQKIFISYGEHDLTDNIIHLVLARLPGAPKGTRGISLFLVPKMLPDGTRNDVRCSSIEHKLGIHASPTCTMVYGDVGGAVGWLLGEEHRGLTCMFTMMNSARLSVALQGVAIAERAYQDALAFAGERRQGAALTHSGNGMAPIIAHADVRRMLATMRSLTHAARAICYATAEAIDRSQRCEDAAERNAASERAALLTPRGQGVCDRRRRRGGLAWHPDPRRDGLRRRDRRRPAPSRCQDLADLRRHQWHPGDRSRDAQAAAVGRRDGAQSDRGDAPDRERAGRCRLREPASGGAADRRRR